MVDNGFLMNLTLGVTDVKLIKMYSMHYIIFYCVQVFMYFVIILNDIVAVIEMNWRLMLWYKILNQLHII